MKKVLFAVAVIGFLASCNNSGDAAKNVKDSIDSVTKQKTESIDEAAKQAKDTIKQGADSVKNAVDSANKKAADSSKSK